MDESGQAGYLDAVGKLTGGGENRGIGITFDWSASGAGASDGSLQAGQHSGETADPQGVRAATLGQDGE